MTGYGAITTGSECEAAAAALGYEYNGETLASSGNRLPYCWFGRANSLVNFNPTGDFGDYVENSPATLVCKETGNSVANLRHHYSKVEIRLTTFFLTGQRANYFSSTEKNPYRNFFVQTQSI